MNKRITAVLAVFVVAAVAAAGIAAGDKVTSNDVELKSAVDAEVVEETNYNESTGEADNTTRVPLDFAFGFHRDASHVWSWLENSSISESPYPDTVASVNLTLKGDAANVTQTRSGWNFSGVTGEETRADANVSDVDLSGGVSISAEVADVSTNGQIIALYNDSGSDVFTLQVTRDEYEVRTNADSSVSNSIVGPAPDASGDSLLATWDADTGNATLYVDGEKNVTGDVEAPDLANVTEVRVAGRNHEGDQFTAPIQEASVYNATLLHGRASLLAEGHRAGELQPDQILTEGRELNGSDRVTLQTQHIVDTPETTLDVELHRYEDNSWLGTGEGFEGVYREDSVYQFNLGLDDNESAVFRYNSTAQEEDTGTVSTPPGGALFRIPYTAYTVTKQDVIMAGAAASLVALVVGGVLFLIPGRRFF